MGRHSESHLIKCTHCRLFFYYCYLLFYSIQSVLTLLSDYIIAMSAEQVMLLDVPSNPSGSYCLALKSFSLFLLQQMGKFQRARILPWLHAFCTTCEARSFNIQTSFGCWWILFEQQFKNYSSQSVMYLIPQCVKCVSCPEHCTLLEVVEWNLFEWFIILCNYTGHLISFYAVLKSLL